MEQLPLQVKNCGTDHGLTEIDIESTNVKVGDDLVGPITGLSYSHQKEPSLQLAWFMLRSNARGRPPIPGAIESF